MPTVAGRHRERETLAGLLWKLLRPVRESLAFSSSLARAGVALIQMVTVLLAGAVLIVVDRGGLSGLGGDDRAEVVGFLVDLIGLGAMGWGLLFGLHLLFRKMKTTDQPTG